MMSYMRCFMWMLLLSVTTSSASNHIEIISYNISFLATDINNNISRELICVVRTVLLSSQQPIWTFKSTVSGKLTQLTTGINLESSIDEHKYSIRNGTFRKQEFTLTVKNITDSDDGEYTCYLRNNTDGVLDSQSVYLRVIYPVATLNVSLSGVDSGGDLHPMAHGVARPEGRYTISCVANGSNPEPQMNITINNQSAAVTMVTRKTVVNGRVWYTGTGSTTVVMTPSMAAIQCAANIPFEWQTWPRYPNVTANMTINFTEISPDIVCQQLSEDASTSRVVFLCTLTSVHEIHCDRISVHFNNGQNKIGHLNYGSSDLNATCFLAAGQQWGTRLVSLALSTKQVTSLSIKYGNATTHDIMGSWRTTTPKNNCVSHHSQHLHLAACMALALIIIMLISV